MCQNMQWQLCAVLGQLPGQGLSKALRYATKPTSLDIKEWRAPQSYPCDSGKSCEGKYTVGDIYFAEVCILQRVCRNTQAMFEAAEGDLVVCDYDAEAFAAFARELKLKTKAV